MARFPKLLTLSMTKIWDFPYLVYDLTNQVMFPVNVWLLRSFLRIYIQFFGQKQSNIIETSYKSILKYLYNNEKI